MHKTASTYIQRSLRKNRGLLRRNGWLLPRRRCQENRLLEAVGQQHWKAWGRWLERAESRNCNLLVSHEALSCSLHRLCTGEGQTRGQWLANRLRSLGWDLKVIGFIRDQESYLNSRYTQLVKRLSVRSDFGSYVQRVMQEDTISQCDLITLFGWLHQSRDIQTVMLPYGSPRNRCGDLRKERPDPFCELLKELDLPDALIDRCQKAKSLNQQPGRLGVALALEVSAFLETHHPNALRSHSKELRSGIERLSKENGWPAEPFNGLNEQLSKSIRARYSSSNAAFCEAFWPGQNWINLFPEHSRPAHARSEASATADERHLLNACRDRVIADNVSPTSTIRRQG